MTESTLPSAPRATPAPYPPLAVGWYATIVLALLYWLSILDRFIISLMVDPIKRDMGITDVQFGMLHGLAFSVTFCLLGLIAGTFADRYSRRWVIYVSVSVWSLATAACGLAQQFWHLLLARVGVGAGEAGLNPSATSMLTDLFPKDRLTTAMAVYAMGSTVGSGTAFFVGGIIVDLVAQVDTYTLPLIGTMRSWQTVFLIIGIPGALLALIIFTLPEPVRRNRLKKTTEGNVFSTSITAYVDLVKFLRARWRFFLPHYLGFGLASMLIGGGGVWYPAHMGRAYSWTPGEIGTALGITLMIVGIVGKLVCGYCVDLIYRRGHKDAQLLWYAWCMVIAAPAAIFTMSSDNPWVFVTGVGIFMILLSPMAACCYAAMNMVTPNELRGTNVAFYSATAGLVAIATGPIIIAWVGSTFFAGPNSLGMGLATVFGVACPLGAIALFSGRKAMREFVLDNDD